MPEERETLILRFSKAVESLLGKADGPEGARMGIAAATAALATFDAPDLALSALAHAYGSDGDLEEYESLFEDAASLARAPSAPATVAKLIELSGQKWSGAGTALLELGGRLAGALGDRHGEALLLVRAACKEPEKVELVRELSARYPHAHGAPVHIGDPKAIGIADLSRPEFGEPTPIYPGEVPMFWACGVTTQAVAQRAKVDFMITHEPAQMFVTDLPRDGDR